MLKLALALAAASTAVAQPVAPSEPTHFVVFNRPGPNFARAAEMREAAIAHTKLYRELAAKGKIIAGGRMSGDPVMGLSVFAAGTDRSRMRALLEADPAVKAGIVVLEFRDWTIQMGRLSGTEPPDRP